jgi:molybdopterin molybdotransferase
MAAAVAPRPVRVPIAESQGLMCAEDVVTEAPMPGFDQAAIDGYAVRSVDVSGGGESDIVLPVMAVIEAGSRTPSRLQPKQAAAAQPTAQFFARSMAYQLIQLRAYKQRNNTV